MSELGSLGSLVISLEANMAQFSSDMGKVSQLAEQTMNKVAGMANVAGKALAALGIAATLDAFKGMVMGAIEAEAELNKLSKSTGTAVETLSGLKSVAKLSQTSMDDVAVGVQKLSKSMVDAQTGSSKSAAAFHALGISSKEVAARLNDPGQMLLLVAQRMAAFNDGAGKNAVAMQLLGKSGANLLPMLQDLAEKGTLVAKVTTAQAAEAEKFQRTMAAWDNRWKELYAVVANEILPTLNDFFGRLVAGGGIARTFTDQVKAWAADGSIRRWAQTAADAVSALMTALVPAAKIAAAYFAVFVAGPAILSAVGAAMEMLVAKTFMLDGALLKTSISAQLASGELTKMRLAGSVLFAAFAGWEIGTWLRENFVEARLAGLTFVGMMLTGWENLKYAGQMAWEATQYAFDAVIHGIQAGFGNALSVIGNGLSLIGADKAAADVNRYADSLKAGLANQKSFAETTAALTAAHQKEIAAIDDNIVDMMRYEMANDGAAKAVKATGEAATQAKKNLAFDPNAAAEVKKFAEAYSTLGTELAKLQQSSRSLDQFRDASEHAKQAQIEFETSLGKFKDFSAGQKAALIDLAKQIDTYTNKVKLQNDALKNQDEGIKAGRDAAAILQSGAAAANVYADALRALADGKLDNLDLTQREIYLGAAYRKMIEDGNKAIALQTDGVKNSNTALAAEIAFIAKDSDAAKYNLELKTRLNMAVVNGTKEYKNAAVAAAAYADALNKVKDVQALGLSLEDKVRQMNADMVLSDQARADAQLKLETDKWKKQLELARQAYDAMKASAVDGNEEQLAVMRDAIDRSESALQDYVDTVHRKWNFDDLKKAWDSIDSAAKSAFNNILTGGTNTWQKLRDSLKSIFVDFLYELTVKKWIVNIGASITGSMVSGMASAAGSSIGGSLLGNLGAGMLGGAFGGGGGGMVASGTIGGLEMGSGGGALSAFADLFASGGGGGMVEAMTSVTVGSEAAAGGLATFAESIGAAIPVIGWFVAAIALIASFAGGGETRAGGQYAYAFSTDPLTSPTSDHRVITNPQLGVNLLQGPSGGELAGDQVRAAIGTTVDTINSILKSVGSQAYLTAFQAGIETSEEDRGGVFAGGTLSTGATFGLSGGGSNYAGDMYDPAFTFSPDAKTALANFSTELIQTTLQALQAASDLPKSIADQLKGTDVKKLSADAATALLKSITDEIAAVNTFNAAVKLLPFANLKNLSFDAADGLLRLLGGLDGFNQKVGSFYQNFYSDDERRQNSTTAATKALADGFAALGIDKIPATVEEFRNLVNAQDLTSESGQKTYAALLALSEAFVTVHGTAQDAANAAAAAAKAEADLKAQRESLAAQLLDLQDPAGARARYEAAVLASMTDDVSRAIQAQIFALEDQAQATKDAADAAEKAAVAAKQLQADLTTFQDGLDAFHGTGGNEHERAFDAAFAALQKLAPEIKTVGQVTNMTAADFGQYDAATRQAILATLSAANVLKNDFTVAMDAIDKAVAGVHASATKSAFDMEYGLKDNQGKYAMLTEQGNTLDAQMKSETDINKIAEDAQKEIELLNQAWALLSEDQQKSALAAYQAKLAEIDKYVQEKGATTAGILEANNKVMADTIAEAAKAAIRDAMASSAAALDNAAGSIDALASRPVSVNLNVTRDPGIEVSIA